MPASVAVCAISLIACVLIAVALFYVKPGSGLETMLGVMVFVFGASAAISTIVMASQLIALVN